MQFYVNRQAVWRRVERGEVRKIPYATPSEMRAYYFRITESTKSERKEADSKISDISQGNRNLPTKLHHLLQNGTTQPLEPPTAVAAVTVTSSSLTIGPSASPSTKTPTPLPSSTSPAGGVLFPQSLLHQQEHYSPTSTKTTIEQVPSTKQHIYSSTHYRDGEQLEINEQSRQNDVIKSKHSLSYNNAWQGRYDAYDKGVKDDFTNGPRQSDGLNVIDDKKNGQRPSHDPYATQVHPYLTKKYVQDDGSVIKQRHYYPKERTCDILRKSEAQKKLGSSKYQSVYQYPKDKGVNYCGKTQPYSAGYPGYSHHHSKHKHSDRHNFNKCVDTPTNALTDLYKISKDTRKSESAADVYKNHTVGRTSEVLTSSNSEGFARYAKYSSQDALAQVGNSVIRDKWTESCYRGYGGNKSDNWQNSNHHLVFSDSKYPDNTKYNPRDNFLPPSYKKWSEGISKSDNNYQQGHSKGEVGKGIVKSYNSTNLEDPKYSGRWIHSSSYLNPKGYTSEDTKYQSEYKYNPIKSSKYDLVPKTPDDLQNLDKKPRSDNFVNNIQFTPNPSFPENSDISKTENLPEFPANNELPNSFDTVDGSSSSSVNRSFSYLSVAKPSSETVSISVPTTSLTPSSTTTTTVNAVSNFPVNSYSNSYSTSVDSLKLSWSATNPTTSLLNSSNHQEVNVEIPVRDSIRSSSHGSSNGSVSSLSQQSHVLITSADQGNNLVKDGARERTSSGSSASNRSRSDSRNDIPTITSTASSSPYVQTTSNLAVPSSSASSYETTGSLTSLVFSKLSWNASVSSSSFTTGGQQLATTSQRPSSPFPLSGIQPSGSSTLGLPSQLPSPLAVGASSYYPGGSQVMFAPSLVPSGSFLSASLQAGGPSSAAAAAAQPSVYGGEALFPPSSQDLLRRELDTRFLASHDRSINIPPPPYMRTEMHQHQHQHTHMHQHSPFLPPPLGAQLLPQAAAHVYDKFPKLDSPFYGRGSIGIPGYPSLSPFLAPGTASATPFGPPGLAAFQPKASSIIKTKNIKPGRWCAMHVRIAWEIYHHQQKQQQVDAHKGSGGPMPSLAVASKSPSELLHPSNALFGSMPKPHDLAFSSSLFRAASQLCIPPLTRPAYPTFGPPPNSFGGLAGLGLPGMGLFGNKDLGPGMLPGDPWNRMHRTPQNFPSPSASSSSSWGGLKAEAERERERLQQRDEQEKERQKKASEKDKKDKEIEKSKEMLRDKREHEKQKERDREVRGYHTANNADLVHNGEYSDRSRERDRVWERPRERRENSRSPIRNVSIPKTDSAFESSNSKPKQDTKVKEEKKEQQIDPGRESSDLRTKSLENNSRPESQTSNISVCNIPDRPHGLSSVNLGCISSSSERPPMPHFWGSMPPGPVLPTNSPSLNINEHYRSLELLREAEREQLMQKYGPSLPSDRLREQDLSRQSAATSSFEATDRQLQMERERQLYASGAKLIPPPLRNDMSTFVPPLGMTSTPPAPGLFPFANSFLNSYCGGLPPPNSKSMSPVSVGNGIPPPPLIPCGPLENPNTPSAPNHSGAVVRSANLSSPPSHQKSGSERGSPPESYVPKEKRDSSSQPRDAESQSR